MGLRSSNHPNYSAERILMGLNGQRTLGTGPRDVQLGRKDSFEDRSIRSLHFSVTKHLDGRL